MKSFIESGSHWYTNTQLKMDYWQKRESKKYSKIFLVERKAEKHRKHRESCYENQSQVRKFWKELKKNDSFIYKGTINLKLNTLTSCKN